MVMFGSPPSSAARRWLGLLLVLLVSYGLAVWWPWYVRRENARLKKELLHQRQMNRLLHGHLDTLQLEARRPTVAPAPTISL